MSAITIGVGLAKNVFSVCEVDGADHAVVRRSSQRNLLPVVSHSPKTPAGPHRRDDHFEQRFE